MDRVVIIGNCSAGIAAVEEIVKSSNDISITVISNEKILGYYRPMLSEYLSHTHNEKRFIIHDLEWYEDNNVKVKLNTTVESIDEESNTIKIKENKFGSKEEELLYDQLILACGSHNFMPPIENIDSKNVYSLRTIKDANHIIERSQTARSIIVIGGGLLGLEAGYQLKKLGLEVTVIEMMDRLLPRQLDHRGSEIFEKKVLNSGVRVLKNTRTESIVASVDSEEKIAEGVLVDSGEFLKSSCILISAGVRSNIELAKSANLVINRGIVVNSKMQTSKDNIYACGDVAEYEGINYSLWKEASDQGKVAGKNIIGVESHYETMEPFTMYSGFDTKIFSIGDVGSKNDVVYDIFVQESDDCYVGLYFIDNIFVGGALIGDISKAVILKRAIKDKKSKQELLDMIK